MTPIEHSPVLAAELVELLAPQPGQTAVDCTFGAGGDARLVADAIGPEGTLICIDRDPAAEERFEEFSVQTACRTRFVGGDFAAGLRALHGEGVHPEMIYMDLGMSSMQVDAWERGFSYSYDAPLDMRMDPRQEFSAADLLNEWPESRIAQVLRRFGEERFAGGIAREIVRRRPLRTTSELVDAVKAGMPAPEPGGRRHRRPDRVDQLGGRLQRPPPDDLVGDRARVPLLAGSADQLGEAPGRVLVDDLTGGRLPVGVHAHVERGVVGVGEAPLPGVELQRA
ncbi:MAG TPA: 16S rRNA (cytosine(1402)-N(4))-methyltransferase, partial [Thermoanaerobaculia bacterium]